MKKNVLKISIIAGGVLGALLTLVLQGLLLMDKNPLGALQFAYLFGALVLVMGGTLKYFRDYKNGGNLSLRQGLRMCLVMSSLGILGYMLSIYISYQNPDLLTTYITDVQQVIENMREQTGDEQTAQALVESKKITSKSIAWNEFKKISFIGLLFSFLLALVFKK